MCFTINTTSSFNLKSEQIRCKINNYQVTNVRGVIGIVGTSWFYKNKTKLQSWIKLSRIKVAACIPALPTGRHGHRPMQRSDR